MSHRVTQDAVEVLRKPDTRNAIVTQAAVEVLRKPDTRNAIVTQIAIEVLRKNKAATGAQQPLVFVVCC